jgi:hypothetical protein
MGIKKIWTKYVKGGSPTEEDVRDIRISARVRIPEELRNQISKHLLDTLKEKSDHSLSHRWEVDKFGTVLVGNPMGWIGDIQIRPEQIREHSIIFNVRVPQNSLYGNSRSNFRKAFESLGLKDGGNDRFKGIIPEGKYVIDSSSDLNYTPEWSLKEFDNVEISVDTQSFLKIIGMNGASLEPLKHQLKMDRAETLGVDYNKYLEKRGSDKPQR